MGHGPKLADTSRECSLPVADPEELTSETCDEIRITHDVIFDWYFTYL
jgi:hypothetical protein